MIEYCNCKYANVSIHHNCCNDCHKVVKDNYVIIKELEAKNTELENKLEIACEALEFYANYENWIATDNGQYKYEGIFFISRDSPYLQTENGKKAFEALSKIKSEGL